MGTVEHTLKCPICVDLFTDPVMLPCGHNFCLTCIPVVWNADVSMEGPFFCPECQILLSSDITLDLNTSLQTQVRGFITSCSTPAGNLGNSPSTAPSPSASVISCDHCIEVAAVAVKTCLTCDASLCEAHAQRHQQRAALREHTLVEVIEDPLSLKCREHRQELKLFCMQEQVPVCSLCVLIGSHKNHQAADLQEICLDFKHTAKSYKERISEKYSNIRSLIEEDEQLMMKILVTEEIYITEWLESKRKIIESHMQEIDVLRGTGKALIQETDSLKFLKQIKAQGLGKSLGLPSIQEVENEPFILERLQTVDELSQALSQHFPRLWSNLRTLTLDPETVHPKLEVSEDRLHVCWNKQPNGEYTDFERYDSQYSILAQESFSSGLNYWEVIVQEKPYWLIGAANLSRDWRLSQDLTVPDSKKVNTGYWCIYHGNGQYLACHDSQETLLSLGGKKIHKLGILVDFHKRELLFYNADTLSLLHIFSLHQCGGPLYPLFNPCIDVNGLNRQPLTMFHLKDHSDMDV